MCQRFILLLLSVIVVHGSVWASVFPDRSAILNYQLAITEGGLKLTIPSQIHWTRSADTYQLSNTTLLPMVGKLGFSSRGQLVNGVINPTLYEELRGKHSWRAEVQGNRVVFSGHESAPQAVQSGMQDRVSSMVALATRLSTNPKLQVSGTQINIPVMGRSSISTWTFKVLGKETMWVGGQAVQALHISRERRTGDSLSIDFWLAPDMMWLPVRLQFIVDNKNQMDQRLQSITYTPLDSE